METTGLGNHMVLNFNGYWRTTLFHLNPSLLTVLILKMKITFNMTNQISW